MVGGGCDFTTGTNTNTNMNNTNKQFKFYNNTNQQESKIPILENEQNSSSKEIFRYINSNSHFSLYLDLFYNCNSLNNYSTISFYTNIISKNKEVVINKEFLVNSGLDEENLIINTLNSPENSIHASNFLPGSDLPYSKERRTNEINFDDNLKLENIESLHSSENVFSDFHNSYSLSQSIFEDE